MGGQERHHRDVPAAALARVAGTAAASGRTGEVLFSVTRGVFNDERSEFHGDPDRPFALASATKLFTTALMVQLRREGLVDWDQPFVGYLPDLDTSAMHVRNGVDATAGITVRHLLTHTSGLPDYFEDPRIDGSTTCGRIRDEDAGWDLAEVIRLTRSEQRPRFSPGTGVHYSDTNFQLLGGIIEHSLGLTFGEAVARRIAAPLGLTHTYCFDAATVDRYPSIAPYFDGRVRVDTPLAMACFGADGGVISTLRDGQRFLRAFFDGTLIPFEVLLGELCTGWRTVFGPIRYGTGLMRFQLPWGPPLDGHSGMSGVVMYVNQSSGTSIVGTTNQVRHRTVPYRMMLSLLTEEPEAKRRGNR